MQAIQKIIEDAWEIRTTLQPATAPAKIGEAVASVIEQLGERGHLAGPSMGALIALVLAARLPHLRRSVAIIDIGPEASKANIENTVRGIGTRPERFESRDAALDFAGDVTHVFHLAAATSVADSLNRPLEHLRVNAGGTMLLAEALRARQPGARLVYIGSAEVYGPPQSLPLSLIHISEPTRPY